jgi:hypothetical protein
MLHNQVKGIYSREINRIVFHDGSTAFFEQNETCIIDDGELAECITSWALTNKHIVAGESIAVL